MPADCANNKEIAKVDAQAGAEQGKQVNKQILIGSRRQSKKIMWKPILVNDVRVGFVGMPSRDSLSDELDQRFAAQQARSYRSAALAMLLFLTLKGRVLMCCVMSVVVNAVRKVDAAKNEAAITSMSANNTLILSQ